MANKNSSLMARGFAPYNFIPFYTGEVPIRYSQTTNDKGEIQDNLPAFNAQNEDTLSGYVDYKIRVLTDLAVGDNQSQEDKAGGVTRPFYRDAQGNLIIPGSEIRGLMRSTAEILSLTSPEAIADERYMYRKLAGNCMKARKEYQAILKSAGPAGKNEDSKTKTPDGVEAGIITMTKSGGYVITPVQTIPNTQNTFLRVSEKTLRQAQEKGTLQFDPSHFLYTDEDCQSPNPDYQPYRGVTVQFSYQSTKFGGNLKFDVKGGTGVRGELLNSAYIGNDQQKEQRTFKDGTKMAVGKSHHYLVSADPDKKRTGIKISPADARAYQHDYERNCIQNDLLKQNADFYALPKRGEKKVFFYKQVGKRLVGFGPTPYFRVFYNKTVRAGLPMHYDTTQGLDYVRALFGYLSQGKDTGYKSRLSFQNATILPYNKNDLVDRALPLLSPKGTAFDMYLEQVGRTLGGEQNQGLLDYNDDTFRLRGNKIYWKRSKAIEAPDVGENQAILSHIEVLKAGKGQDKYFTGRVYFDNLHKDELGLLLLCLQYKDAKDTATNESRLLGSAKPFGYGKVEITLEGLRLLDETARYTSINPVLQDGMDSAEDYKKAFKNAMNEELRKDPENMFGYEELPSIKVYREWLKNDQVDQYLDRQGRVYMSVEKSAGGPTYGNCEPIAMAYEILEIKDMEAPEPIVNDMSKKSIAEQPKDAEEESQGSGYTVVTRDQKDGCYRLVVDSKNGDSLVLKLGTSDQAAVRAFHNQTVIKCKLSDVDAEYASDKDRVKPGDAIYAKAAKKPIKNKKNKLETPAQNWYLVVVREGSDE